MIGPSEIGLEQEKALAVKAIAALGKNGFAYGTPSGLAKPAPGKPVPNRSGRNSTAANPSAIDQLKRAIHAKAEAGDPRAQFALGKLYQSGSLAPDGTPQHDYTGAANGITRHPIAAKLRQSTNSRFSTAMDWACLPTPRGPSSSCRKPPKLTTYPL